MPKNRSKDSNIPHGVFKSASEIAIALGTTWEDVLTEFVDAYVHENMELLANLAKEGRLLKEKEAALKSAQPSVVTPASRPDISETPSATARPSSSTAYNRDENPTP
ncbi:hypothetical protein [Ethanoligenens sp.]|uniref:hypothetical protein n=1 Tax=Ethanoligenens sp. TaxID=2099655 RepID=UPI0039E86917